MSHDRKLCPRLILSLAVLLCLPRLSAESIVVDSQGLGLKGAVKELLKRQTTYVPERQRRVQRIVFNNRGQKTKEWLFGGGQEIEYSYDGSGRLEEIRDSSSTTTTVTLFDREGNKIEEIRRERGGRIMESWKRIKSEVGEVVEYKSYGSDKRTLQHETIGFGRAGQITEKRFDTNWSDPKRWEYEYDQAGNLIKGKYYERPFVTPEVWSSSYDDAGNLIEVLHTYGERDLRSKRSYFYGEGSKLTRQVVRWYSDNGILDHTFAYTYDPRGNVLEETYRHLNIPFKTKWSYAYSQKNERTREEFYNSEGTVFAGYRVTKEYDSQDRHLETARYDLAGQQLSRSRYTYNAYGDLLASITYNPDNSLMLMTSYEYEYDRNNNWIVKRTFNTNNLKEEYNILSSKEERTISYFD